MGNLKIIISLLFSSFSVFAGVYEGTFAASSTQYRTSGDQTSGYTVRMRYRNFGVGANKSGAFYVLDTAGTLSGGWGVSGEFMNWEAGVGGSYSPIFGPSLVLSAGVGADLGSGMTVSLPIFLNSTTGITATPYFGWRW